MGRVTRLRTGRILLSIGFGFLCVSFSLTLSALSPAWAIDLSHPKYHLQTRKNAAGQEDRKEGIESVKVAGEHLELIGAFFNVPGLQDTPGTTYRLGFYLKEAERHVNIQVRDYDVFRGMNFIYWMLPLRMRYGHGFQEFTWDAALARELGINIQDLGAIASLRGYGLRRVAPMLLHTQAFPAQMQVQGCRFVFMPNTTMTVDYRIYPKEQETYLVKQGSGLQWGRYRRNSVIWDGKDPQGHPMPEGVYVLKLSATYIPVPGRPARELPFDVAFYYTPVIDARTSTP